MGGVCSSRQPVIGAKWGGIKERRHTRISHAAASALLYKAQHPVHALPLDHHHHPFDHLHYPRDLKHSNTEGHEATITGH